MFSENQSEESCDLDSVKSEKVDMQWEEYKDHPQPVQLAQTFVYDLILKNVYKEKKSFL